jgi:signal transduction histidine kinase
VLDFARPLRIEPARVELVALVREAAGSVLGEAAGISTRLAFEDSEIGLLTDGERLRAALVNLVTNARDSLAGRAEPATIELGGRRLEGGRVLLWVEDSGDGISTADMQHVFEPYFTTRRTGTGLGLAITRKTVEALGGSLRLDSRPGAFTRAEIELPASPPESAPESR